MFQTFAIGQQRVAGIGFTHSLEKPKIWQNIRQNIRCDSQDSGHKTRKNDDP